MNAGAVRFFPLLESVFACLRLGVAANCVKDAIKMEIANAAIGGLGHQVSITHRDMIPAVMIESIVIEAGA